LIIKPWLKIFQLHLAALKSLKTEISDLTKQLQLVTEKNEVLEASINQIKVNNSFIKFECTWVFLIDNLCIGFNWKWCKTKIWRENNWIAFCHCRTSS